MWTQVTGKRNLCAYLKQWSMASFSVVLRLKWSWCCLVYTLTPHVLSLKVRAGPIIFTQLYAACTSCFLYSHRRMLPETVSLTANRNRVELSKTCESNATSLPVRSVTEEHLKTRCYCETWTCDWDFVINQFDNTAHLSAQSISHVKLQYDCLFNVCPWGEKKC